MKNWVVYSQQVEVSRRMKQDHKQSMASQKKSELVHEKHLKNIHNLIKWDEYRIRKDALMEMFYKAKTQLAMKNVWVLVTSFHPIID